jgi:uncharacterized protein
VLRLVLDTNVWLDWLVFEDPALAPLRAAHAAGEVKILIDEVCEDELARVLCYDLGRHSLDPERRESCLATLKQTASLMEAMSTVDLPRCQDPDDQKFLVCAAAAGADALVTKDNALLVLAKRTPFRILRPEDLAALLRAAPDGAQR